MQPSPIRRITRRRNKMASRCPSQFAGMARVSASTARSYAPGRCAPQGEESNTALIGRETLPAHRDRAASVFERREPAQRTYATALEQFIELRAMNGKLRAIGF